MPEVAPNNKEERSCSFSKEGIAREVTHDFGKLIFNRLSLIKDDWDWTPHSNIPKRHS